MPHVCLVEDYPLTELMVTKVLRYAGLEVTAAASGPILDSLLKQNLVPDMFLMDLDLPGETGVQVARRLRADPRWDRCPIIAFTAFASRHDRQQLLRLGFNGLIGKPFDLSSFTATVWSFLPEEVRRTSRRRNPPIGIAKAI